MKEEIISYLQGPRNYSDGVALYKKYGLNLRLKRQFAFGETETSMAILTEELRKLAGLSEQEFKNIRRRSLMSDHAPEAKPVAVAPNPDSTEGRKPVTETQKKIIRFRERFKFLNEPDCPDILKILVADMFTSFANYKKALEQLDDSDAATTDENAALCETAVEEFLRNREIWDELEYYEKHGQVLGKAAKIREQEKADALSKLTDVELMNKRRSAEVNVSKRKKALEAAVASGDTNKVEKEKKALSDWMDKKEAIEKELDSRKKK